MQLLWLLWGQEADKLGKVIRSMLVPCSLSTTRLMHWCRHPLAKFLYHGKQEARTTLATVGELDQAQLGAALKSWAVKAPETGNDITEPQPFKLMFQVLVLLYHATSLCVMLQGAPSRLAVRLTTCF